MGLLDWLLGDGRGERKDRLRQATCEFDRVERAGSAALETWRKREAWLKEQGVGLSWEELAGVQQNGRHDEEEA